MKILSLYPSLLLLCVVFSFYHCTNDKLPEPLCGPFDATYNGDVKKIIDESCAYIGCHDGQGGIGAGDYSDYAGLQPILNNLFFNRVITQADNPALGMPPNSSVYPQSQKDDLTAEELEIINCWISANYPEN